MGHITKPLKVWPAIKGTITSGETATVTLPAGVEYFRISIGDAGGDLHWAWKAADIAAGNYHYLAAADITTDNIVANPLSLALKADGGNVTYSLFVVIEGR